MRQHQFNTFWKTRTDKSKDRERKSGGLSVNIPASAPFLARVLAGPRRFFAGLYKWYVALKYQVFRASGGILGRGRFPWVKLSLLVLALVLFFKKDLQFTLNLGQGKQTGRVERAERHNQKVGELGIASQLAPRKEQRQPRKEATTATASDLRERDVQVYIDRFAEVAQMEMKKFGIPASIKMAQGIAESWAGTHPVATQGNNHFGTPMQEMAYNTAWENWRAHSVLLQQNYPELFELPSNYTDWARGLQKAGYSDERGYARKLIQIVEKFDLKALD